MKRFLLPIISILFLVAAFFASCDVGLGEAVDTMPPTVSIELPSAGYIIRDSFVMNGTCSDESGVASVEISLKNTSTKKTYPSYFAEIDSIKNVWTCKIDPLVAEKSVPDGTYEATVTATDKAGRKTSATKSFVLDNTAPILVLTRPATKISIDENQTYDTYGAEFDITGQAADDNNIEKLVVSIYEDAAKTKHIKDVELKNVPPTIDLAVAKWGEKDGELAGIYESIYGEEKAGTKLFYCTITIYDEARHCPPIENDTGNSRNAYYLYKDIYADLLKKYKTTQIYHMLNGSYESTDVSSRDVSSDVNFEIQKVKAILESSKTEIGSFSLNPENSPIYSLSGFEALTGKTENENYNLILNDSNDYGILSSSSITVKFSAGLDKSPLVEKSLGFYFVPYIQNDDGTWSVSKKDSDRIWVIKPYERDSEGIWKDTIDVSEFAEEKQSKALAYFKDVRKYIATVGSYDFTATMNISTTEFLPIATGKIYALGATGCDENFNSFINLNSYGFMFLSSGAAPTLEIEKIDGKIAKSSWYVKKDSGMTISGKVTAEEKTNVKITVQDKNNKKVEIPGSVIPVFTSSDSPLEEQWELTVPNEYFTKTIDENGNTISSNYTITVSAVCGSRTTEKQIAVGYDVDGPVVEISSILPYASISLEGGGKKYTVNGTFNVKVSVTDEFYKLSEAEKTTLAIFSDYGTANPKELYKYTTSDSNISKPIESRKDLNGIDKKDLTIVVTAYDYAGNKTVETQTIYLDQDTDKPTVKLTNAVLKEDDAAEDYTNSYPTGGKKNLFLSSAPINATISDDDGIESIEVNIYDEKNNKLEKNSKSIEKKDITSNPYPLTFEVPSDIGIYSVEIIVKDTESGLQNDKCKFYFMVDIGKPSIIVNRSSNGDYFGKKSGTIHITGTYSGLAGLNIYRKNGESITGKLNENSQSGTWEDDFPVDTAIEESANPFESGYVIKDTKERTSEVSFKYYIDNTPPVVTITKINDKNLVEDRMFRFSGTSKDTAGAGIASGLNSRWYLLKKKNEVMPDRPDSERVAQEKGWKELSGVSEEWNFTQEFNEGLIENFCEGEYILYVIAFDIAKNVSKLTSYNFAVDLNVPRIETFYSITNTEESSIADSNSIAIIEKPYIFKYKVTDTYGLASENPVSVKVYKNDSNGNPQELTTENYKNNYKDGTGSITIFEKNENLQSDGTYIYEITAKDSNNKVSTVKRTIVLDTTSPIIEIISPDEKEWITTSNKIVVNGTATDENGVKAVFYSTSSKENAPALDKNGSFNVSEPWKKLTGTTSWKIPDFGLKTGEGNNLYLIAFDIYGNKSEIIEKQFKYDGEAPKIDSVKITKFAKDSETGEEVTLYNNYSGYLNGSTNKIKLEIKTSDNYKLDTVKISAIKDSETSENWSLKTIGISTDSTSLEYFIGRENSSQEKYLAAGIYKISVVAADISGQSVTNQYTITIDTEKPTIGTPNLSVDPSTTNKSYNGYNFSASPILSITPSDSGSGILGVYYMVSSGKLEGDIYASTIDSPLTKDSGVNKYSRKLSLQEGTNYINVKVEDNAGNVSYYTTDALTWNVDKTGPIIAFESPDVSAMLSNKVSQTYKIKVSDELSGIRIIEGSEATVSLVSKSNEDAAIAAQKPAIQKDSENNYYVTGTFTADDMGKIQKGDSAELSVVLADAVGNESTGKLTLTFDNTPPTVDIVNPAAAVVNGTVSISGTAKDNSGLAKVTVYRKKLLSGDAEDYLVDSGDYSGSYTKIKEFIGAEAYNWEISKFDTKDFADNSSIIFYVIAEDTAGNTENAVKQVTIDQDSDRPEIKFTNLNIKNMTSVNFKMHKQETLYGTVTDDDGVLELHISEDDGKSWSDNLYDGGAWTYEFQRDDNGSIDSKHTLKFKVIDAEKAEFVSSVGSGDMLKSPKLIDSATNRLGYKENGSYSLSADTNLYLQVDTKDPSVGSTYYILTEERKSFTDEEITNYTTSSEWKLETGLSSVGGKKKYLYWLIDSSDSSGIASVTATLAGMSAGEPIKTVIVEKTDSPERKICVFEFDVSSGYANGSANLIAVATDKATRSNQVKISVQIDNKPPVIEVNSHKNGAGVYGSEPLNLRGISDDCEKLYFKITDSSDVPDTDFGNDSAEKNQWEEIDAYTSTGSWSIIFNSGNNVSGNIDYYAKEGTLNKYYDKLFIPSSADKEAKPKDMYIWLYGEDSLGNVSVPTGIYLNVNPQGDQPVVSVSYPEAKTDKETSVGGTIRITGSTKIGAGSVTVDKVWIQIDPDYNETKGFDENWESELEFVLSAANIAKSEYGIVSTGISEIGNAILAKGSTASWNLTINANREFNTTSNRNMAIRVWAYSSSGKLSESVVVPFVLDPNSPVIGGTEELYLVQYKDSNWGEIVRKQKFENNMWISGTWYLTGSVEDDSGIGELTWSDYSDNTTKSIDLIKSDYIRLLNNDKAVNNYRFSIPVGKDDLNFGKLKYRIYAVEASGDKIAESIFDFQYDNKAPELKATDAGYRNELSMSGLKIVQNNGTYTINGTVKEDSLYGANQSGFSRVILFFTRTLNNESYIVDPMLSSGNSGMENALKLSDLTEKGGIYWQKRTFGYDSDSGKIQLDEIPGNFIRSGGLCRIDDIDYVIKSVDYNAKTVTLKTVPAVNAFTKNAYFAVAQVIDNTSIENGTTNAFDFNISDDPTTNGDGDQMVEGVSQSGTTWKWSASINSSLILDGSIEINLVAFDEAGNSSEVKTYSGTVSNNAPRIAGVMFGSDDNNDGTVSDDEMVKSYSMIYTALNNGGIRNGYITANQIADNVTIPLSKNDSGNYSDVINIKGNFCVRPEIVGGNHGIGYNYNVTRGNSTIYTVNDVVQLSNVHSTGDVVRSENSNLDDIVISLKDMISNNLTDGANTVFNITLWDYTDGATPGTDSNSAKLHIYTNVDIYDEESPVITINPFYWNSVTDNSVYYVDGIAQGHIELESDLPTGTFTAIKTGIYDRDPKVSGKIKIEGTASDNAMIKELRMTIPGLFADKVVGEYSYSATNGWAWKSNGDLDTDGFAAEIENTSFGNNGHEIKWTVLVDTAQIKNVAVADVSVTATVVDRGKINANLEYIQRTENGKQSVITSSAYKMDVVPYITGLDTILTDLEVSNPSVYGRTALGKYPVYYYRQTTSGSVNAETIIVNGFNLSGGTVAFASDTTATGTLATDGSVTIPKDAKSGKISVSVNGIESLNNVNNNEASGDYNRQPNNQNNNLLTDDVEIAIWEINSKAAIAESGELSEVVMHVNPANGMLGFAFAHSQDLASYPTGMGAKVRITDCGKNGSYEKSYDEEKGSLSYQTWTTDWTGVNQVGFIFDNNGNMFGTNGGTDTYTPDKKVGRFGLISNLWGSIADKSASWDKYSGYTKFRRLRLEYLGLTNKNGTYASNVYRFAKGDCSQFATVVPFGNTNLSNLYMMYYDNTLGELKFKAGQYDTSWSYGSGWLDKVNLENDGFTKASFSFGDFADDAYNSNCSSDAAYNPNYATTSIVSTVASGANGNSNAKPGTYYSIAAVPSSDGNSDVVVAVWYDAINKNLWYSYITNPLTNAGKRNSAGAVSTEWATPVAILKGTAGESCAIAVDDDNHIHIAAYSRKNAGSLYYAYLDSYSSKFDETKNLVKVDSYGSTGQYITMEVAKDTSGNNIPYIGYWMNSMSYPKYAYLVDTDISNGPKSGVDENNRYTGAWESIMLPTSSEVLRDDINIGLYKYQSAQNGHLKGEIREIPKLYSTSGTGTEYAGEKNGIAGGNGTANPVLAYGISETGSGYIETAQLK